MPPHPHKLDLAGVSCEQFQIAIEIPTSDSAVDLINASLEDDVAWASYRRGRTQQSVVFSSSGHRDESISHYIGVWFTPGPEAPIPQQRGDVWAALDRAYEAATRHEGVYVSGSFNLDSESGQPKMIVPITLFSSGAFPFNQIQGYRAALVEDERTIWSAILDQHGATGDYHVAIQIDDHDSEAAKTSRDLFDLCVGVCKSLMVGRVSA